MAGMNRGNNASPDYLFIVGSLLLFLLIGVMPEVPLLSKSLSTTTGVKLYYLTLEALFSFLVFLYYIRDKCFPFLKADKLAFLALVWLFWVLLAALMSEHLYSAVFRLVETVLHAMFLLALFVFFKRHKESYQIVQYFILIGFLLYSLFLVVGWVLFDTWENNDYRYVFVGFGNIRHFGYYVLTVFVVTAGLLWRALYFRRSVLSVIYMVILILASTWLFVLGGRGPFFALFLSIGLLAVMRGEYFSGRFVALIFVAVIAGLCVSVFVSQEPLGPARLVSSFIEKDTLNQFSSSRLSIWRDALALLAQYPLFGVGPDGYLFELLPVYPMTSHPHGIIPQAFLEWGIPGAVIFFLLLFLSLFNLIKHMNAFEGADLQHYGLLWAVLALLSFSLIDGVLYHIRSTFLFVVLLSMLLASTTVSHQNGSATLKYSLLLVLILSSSLVFQQGRAFQVVISGDTRALTDEKISTIKSSPALLADARIVATLANMSRAWGENTSYDEQLQWYEWLDRNSSLPWYFVYLHAELLLKNGHYGEAEALLARYSNKTPDNFLEYNECLQNRYRYRKSESLSLDTGVCCQ